MAWINGLVNDNQVVAESAYSNLVKLAGSDFKVWISRKCFRRGTHKANSSVGLIDDKEYEIFRTGNGKHNSKDKIESRMVSGAELSEMLFVQG